MRQCNDIPRSSVDIVAHWSTWYQTRISEPEIFDTLSITCSITNDSTSCYLELFLFNCQLLTESHGILSELQIFLIRDPQKDLKIFKTVTETHQSFWQGFFDSSIS